MTQTYRYPEGDVYEGDWSKEGKKHGIGRISFTDESMYEGRFMNGFFSGYGTLRLADGTVYAGEFSEGLFHGFGVYIRFDGMQYEGEFKEGTPNGPGLVTFPNGSSGKPRQEGFFEGSKLKSRQSVSQFVRRAEASKNRALATTLNNVIKE